MEFLKVLRNKSKRVKDLKRYRSLELKQNLETSAYDSSLQNYMKVIEYIFMDCNVRSVYVTPPDKYLNHFINGVYNLSELQKYKVEQISENKFKISELELNI